MEKVNMIYSGHISKEDKQFFVENYIFDIVKKEEELRIKYWHKLSTYYNLTKKSKMKLCIYIFDKYKQNNIGADNYFIEIISTLINNQYIYQESDGRRKSKNNIPRK